MVGILVSFWDGLFSGAMLVSGRVMRTKTYDGLCLQSLLTQSYSHVKTCWDYPQMDKGILYFKKFYGPSFTNCNTKSTHASPTTCATSARQVPAAMAKFQVSSSSSDCRLVKVTVSKGTKWGQRLLNEIQWNSAASGRHPALVPSPSGRVPAKICFQTCGS